ncbi:BolA family protein [Histidinibacterium lentulum]|uniref:BolA family transcriptional regulator n=1 Tax=Histidinibacterium lentulum TaxID=2480588 RepID=A0A3N2QYJ2_9RHOB|nr:BolA family protein [Histidinibacterium lentulum]ROU00267.1 BolA family transcriptional regulator [Histidinibacterium lentulum]
MGIEAEIRARLEAAFAPERLVVRNDSARHAGHAGDDGSGESHWHVEIEAAAFKDMGRVQRHRAVHGALGDVMDRIHALALDVR